MFGGAGDQWKNEWQEKAGRLLTVYTFGDAAVTLDPVEAGILLDLPSALREAVAYGHGSNPIDNLKLRMNSGKEITDIILAEGADVSITELQKAAKEGKTHGRIDHDAALFVRSERRQDFYIWQKSALCPRPAKESSAEESIEQKARSQSS